MSSAKRNILSEGKLLLHGARKLLRINHDIVKPQDLEEINSTCDQLTTALKTSDAKAVAPICKKLDTQLVKVFPQPKHAGLRENVEVILVAFLIAIAVRTFFIQPFKIPTGSMQPTLYGIIQNPTDCDPNPTFIKKVSDFFLYGKTHQLGRCTVKGDFILVERFSYHFRKPRRGEVIVFETNEIPDIPDSSRGKFYIKRLIALGNDVVEIDPPHVRINGEILNTGPIFDRIYSLENGYNGYELPRSSNGQNPAKYLNKDKPTYQVPDKSLFVLGDNTRSSLDGRYWGSLPERELVGRAIGVYWPFSSRVGLIQ